MNMENLTPAGLSDETKSQITDLLEVFESGNITDKQMIKLNNFVNKFKYYFVKQLGEDWVKDFEAKYRNRLLSNLEEDHEDNNPYAR